MSHLHDHVFAELKPRLELDPGSHPSALSMEKHGFKNCKSPGRQSGQFRYSDSPSSPARCVRLWPHRSVTRKSESTEIGCAKKGVSFGKNTPGRTDVSG